MVAISAKSIAIFFSITALVAVLGFAYVSFHSHRDAGIPLGEELSKDEPGLPVRLVVPQVGVDAPIERVGLTADGAMESPAARTSLGWYEAGARPGEIGSAVVDGHYGWDEGAPAAFDGLQELVPGDVMFVIDDAGKRISFVVMETRVFSAGADTGEVFASAGGKAHLNLITCFGDWDDKSRSYPQRLVVFAERVN